MKKINFKKYFIMDFHHWQWILTIVGLSVTGMIFDHYFADHPYYPDIIKTITDFGEFELIIFFIKGMVIWAAILSPFALYILIEELMIYYKKK
jgi:hypothetical protein